MFSRTLTTAALCLFTLSANAAVVNGTFSDGTPTAPFPGWSFNVAPLGGAVPTATPLAQIADAGSDPYAALKTPFLSSGFLYEEMFQTVTLTSGAAILSYDLNIDGTTTDSSDLAGTGNRDLLLTGIRTSADQIFLSRLRISDGLTRPIGQPDEIFDLISTITPTNSGFAHGVRVDLSAYIGQEVEIFFRAVSFSDGKLTTFGVDNVTLSAAAVDPSVIPLPASLSLMLLGAGSLLVVRRRRRAT